MQFKKLGEKVMYSVGDEFYTPIASRDLGLSSMQGPMQGMGMYGGMYGGGMYPSYLGGITMGSALNKDAFLHSQTETENKEKGTFKKVMKWIGGCAAICATLAVGRGIRKAGGVGTFLSNSGTKINNWFKKIL